MLRETATEFNLVIKLDKRKNFFTVSTTPCGLATNYVTRKLRAIANVRDTPFDAYQPNLARQPIKSGSTNPLRE